MSDQVPAGLETAVRGLSGQDGREGMGESDGAGRVVRTPTARACPSRVAARNQDGRRRQERRTYEEKAPRIEHIRDVMRALLLRCPGAMSPIGTRAV